MIIIKNTFTILIALLVNALAFDWHSDSLAVRAILDANGLQNISVYSVSDTNNFQPRRIHGLYLDGLGIDTLPDQIGNLKELWVLSVRKNKLRALNKVISSLPYLHTIDADSNEIAILPDTLQNKNIISLKNNKLTKMPEFYFGTTSYHVLDLSNNFITSISSKSWQTGAMYGREKWNPYGSVPDWKSIDLSGNLLKTLPEIPDNHDYRCIRFNFSNNLIEKLPLSITRLRHEICTYPQNPTPGSSSGYNKCMADIHSFINFSSNQLCNIPDSIKSWLDSSAGDWRSSQLCSTPIVSVADNKTQCKCISTSSTFSVYLSDSYNKLSVKVFNLQGIRIYNEIISGNHLTISNFKPGIYFLSITEKKPLLKTVFSIVQ